MDEIGRRQLPHEPPSWLTDPSREIFFLTLCVRDRTGNPLIEKDTAAKLLRAVQFYHENAKWWAGLALIMPDHLHLLVSFAGEVAPVVRSWKHWTGRNFDIQWQRDFFDHRLRREERVSETADYILQNPVRAGLVENWQDWPHKWIATHG